MAVGRFFLSIAFGLAFAGFLASYSGGPDPGRSGAPGDTGNCASGSCHLGSPEWNTGATLHFPEGPFYRPGVTQRLIVHGWGQGSEQDRRAFGYQLSARLASNPSTEQAGSFAAAEIGSFVQCRNGSVKPAAGCPPAFPLEFIQHRRPYLSNVWEVDWTPPPSPSGPVRFFLALNVVNNRGDPSGDRVYLNQFTIEEAAGSLSARLPFGGGTASPGAWIEIYGQELANVSRDWTGLFTGNVPPKQIAGVSVRIGGQSAVLSYVSPRQVNALVPGTLLEGIHPVEILTSSGRAANGRIDVAESSPSVATSSSFFWAGRQYAAAMLEDLATFVIPEGLPLAAPSRPARCGDRIVIFATGCGPASPQEDVELVARDPLPLASPVEVRLNGESVPATAYRTPEALGLCQIHFPIQEKVPAGVVTLTLRIGKAWNAQRLHLFVQ